MNPYFSLLFVLSLILISDALYYGPYKCNMIVGGKNISGYGFNPNSGVARVNLQDTQFFIDYAAQILYHYDLKDIDECNFGPFFQVDAIDVQMMFNVLNFNGHIPNISMRHGRWNMTNGGFVLFNNRRVISSIYYDNTATYGLDNIDFNVPPDYFNFPGGCKPFDKGSVNKFESLAKIFSIKYEIIFKLKKLK